MTDCITTYASSVKPTLRGFAEHLRARLSEDLTERERRGMTLAHVAGYADGPAGAHPEMHFVRNCALDLRTGDYIGPGTKECVLSEDFWGRDYRRAGTSVMLDSGGWQYYFNGFPQGRMAYLGFVNVVNPFLNQIWNTPGWKFRAPRSLDELEAIIELQIHAIDALFKSSDYSAAFIGGPTQVRKIPPPANAVTL
jgi:hypothetical protein